MPDNFVVSCAYCGEPVAGGKNTEYSLTTSLEICQSSPTGFHESIRISEQEDLEYREGQCAGCFEMRPLQVGNTRCDSCMSTGSPWLIWRQDDDDE